MLIQKFTTNALLQLHATRNTASMTVMEKHVLGDIDLHVGPRYHTPAWRLRTERTGGTLFVTITTGRRKLTVLRHKAA